MVIGVGEFQMAGPQQGLLPSILDRLDDPESRGTVARSGYTLEQMARAIQKDLERLLNTRCNDATELKQYRLYSQVLGYGLPDLATLGRLAEQDIQGICRMIEEKILYFEPRLKDVHVEVGQGEAGNPLRIQFHLQAVLSVDPAPEMVFDTTLDLASGHFSHKT